jgi:hypothetical protein
VLGEENHYATTCYHVCFNETLSEDINTAHNTLKEDYENNSAGCCDVRYEFRGEDGYGEIFFKILFSVWERGIGVTCAVCFVTIYGEVGCFI